MEVGQKLNDLNVVFALVQFVCPCDVLLTVALVSSIAQAMEFAAGKGGKLALDLRRCSFQLLFGIELGRTEVDGRIRIGGCTEVDLKGEASNQTLKKAVQRGRRKTNGNKQKSHARASITESEKKTRVIFIWDTTTERL